MTDAWMLADGVTVRNRMDENRKPGAPEVPFSALFTLRVTAKTFEPDQISENSSTFIEPLLKDLGYTHYDVIDIRESRYGKEKFELLAVTHFSEHLHEDDEVRLILEGGGYFDIRSANDEWIRVETNVGDCIVVPAGLYHRFTTKHDRITKALRLFKENTRWLAVPRGAEADETEARKNYLQQLRKAPTHTANAGLLLRGSVSQPRANEKHYWKVNTSGTRRPKRRSPEMRFHRSDDGHSSGGERSTDYDYGFESLGEK